MNKDEILALVDEEDEVIVRCNNCDNYYLEQGSGNEAETPPYLLIMNDFENTPLKVFRACPKCKTDAYLMNININDHE